MKTFLVFCAMVAGVMLTDAQVAINTDGSSPDTSAALHVKSTNKGILIPSMTSAQRGMISEPTVGLLVFDTDTESFWFKETAGWVELRDGNIATLADDDGDTRIQVEESTDEDKIRFDLGGTEHFVMDGGRLEVNSPKVYVGQQAGANDLTDVANIGIGSRALRDNISGAFNVAVGADALLRVTDGLGNVALGNVTGSSNALGNYNVFVGHLAGLGITHDLVDDNVMLGYRAGYQATGSGHVLLGRSAGEGVSGNNKLFIDNTSTSDPLIYGEFDNDFVRVNGNLQVQQVIEAVSGDGIELRTQDATPRITLRDDGHVVMDQRLAVNGMAASAPTDVLQVIASGGAGEGITLETTSGLDGADLKWINSSSAQWSIDQLDKTLRFNYTDPGFSTKMFLDSAGNLGIGTTPVAGSGKLQVNSVLRTQGVRAFGAAGLDLATDDGTTRMTVEDNGHLTVEQVVKPMSGNPLELATTDGTSRLRILTDGNISIDQHVGIDAAPDATAELTIGGQGLIQAASSNGISFRTDDGTARLIVEDAGFVRTNELRANTSATLSLRNQSGSQQVIVDNTHIRTIGPLGVNNIVPGGSDLEIGGSGLIDALILRARTNFGLHLRTDDDVTRIQINDVGDVGIGGGPGAKLHVYGKTKTDGIGMPGEFGPDSAYVGTDGNYIAFGHVGSSEDFIGYKTNSFYLLDSPGGGDTADPNLYVGGNLGVGLTSSTHPLEMASGAHVTAGGVWTNASDISRKSDILPLSYGLRDVMQLQPVAYHYRADDSPSIGFVAQDMEQVIPEVVSGAEGNKGIAYGLLTSVLVRGMQEQQALIDQQARRIDALQSQLAALAQQLAEITEQVQDK
ncbi:MAG: tail fiber domain-containing protein [Saprospiraceae bacterium]|nr:tail fiber domain-containing protein [Saprospiraceae bacterium]